MKEMWRVIICIDPTLQEGFRIAIKGSEIELTAADDRQMLWLQYQLIKKISKEDPRINGSDLPPAIINLTDTCGTFAFDYQSIYSPSGLNPDYSGVMGLNNFDDSWGIWGHNLRKVLGDNVDKVYATIHGKTDDSQLCFSSEEMYRQIESYIVDNIGEKGSSRFVIAPDDTPYACTCASCTAMGNVLLDDLYYIFQTFLFYHILSEHQAGYGQTVAVQCRYHCQCHRLSTPTDRRQECTGKKVYATAESMEESFEEHLYMGLHQQLR